MKIIQRFKEDEYMEDARMQLEVTDKEGKKIVDLYVGTCEPEDANLYRDLNFVYDIADWLKAAYEAGKNGESFESVEEPWTDD